MIVGPRRSKQGRGFNWPGVPPSISGGQIPVPVAPNVPLVRQATMGAIPYNMLVDPGITNPPIIFEPFPPLSQGAPLIWMIASGGSINWGGCFVWVSNDGSTYRNVGAIYRGNRQGQLTANLASHADPDNVNTLSVVIALSQGQLLSGSASDKDNFITLCIVDGELISYETATLTGPFAYDLTLLRRGCYGTPIQPHSIGGTFGRVVVDQIFSFEYPINMVGQTVHIKLTSFNIFGQEIQDISLVSATSYAIVGAGLQGPGNGALWVVASPISGVTLTPTTVQQGYTLTPAGTLASLTVALPGIPQDGQTFDIETTQTISSLTVTSLQSIDGGGPFLLSAHGGVSYRYNAATTTWYRRW
jgi:hypothetical protein